MDVVNAVGVRASVHAISGSKPQRTWIHTAMGSKIMQKILRWGWSNEYDVTTRVVYLRVADGAQSKWGFPGVGANVRIEIFDLHLHTATTSVWIKRGHSRILPLLQCLLYRLDRSAEFPNSTAGMTLSSRHGETRLNLSRQIPAGTWLCRATNTLNSLLPCSQQV